MEEIPIDEVIQRQLVDESVFFSTAFFAASHRIPDQTCGNIKAPHWLAPCHFLTNNTVFFFLFPVFVPDEFFFCCWFSPFCCWFLHCLRSLPLFFTTVYLLLLNGFDGHISCSVGCCRLGHQTMLDNVGYLWLWLRYVITVIYYTRLLHVRRSYHMHYQYELTDISHL